MKEKNFDESFDRRKMSLYLAIYIRINSTVKMSQREQTYHISLGHLLVSLSPRLKASKSP